MPTREHDLAQLNVGRLVAPDDSPTVAEFIGALDEVNALADAAPGFCWRFQTEDGNAIAERPFPDDDLMLVNFSTWESTEALADFVFGSSHVDFLRRRREWFEPLGDVVTVLWWVPAGHRPHLGRGDRAPRAPAPTRPGAVRVHLPPAFRARLGPAPARRTRPV